MKLLTERYQADLPGVLSCYDRRIITGTLPGACYAGGMISFLNFRHINIKIFDYAKVFADPLRERIRKCAHELAEAHGVSIEHVNKSHIRNLHQTLHGQRLSQNINTTARLDTGTAP